MNADIRLSTTFFSHRKTKKLNRAAGPAGIVSLLTLWARVAVEKPSGKLVGWSEDDIAIEADYDGEPIEFVSMLIDLGFLNQDDDGTYLLHNWEERQGWVANSAERSDKARLLRMAKTHNVIYKKLIAEGCTGVTREQYNKLTKIQRPVNDTLNTPLTPAPAPLPEPLPEPLPAPSLKEKESTKKSKPKKKTALYLEFKPDWISVEYWQALIENRKFKKLQNSKLALTTFTNALQRGVKAGYTVEFCIGEFVASSWKRFDHSWIKNKNDQNNRAGKSNGYIEPSRRTDEDWLS